MHQPTVAARFTCLPECHGPVERRAVRGPDRGVRQLGSEPVIETAPQGAARSEEAAAERHGHRCGLAGAARPAIPARTSDTSSPAASSAMAPATTSPPSAMASTSGANWAMSFTGRRALCSRSPRSARPSNRAAAAAERAVGRPRPSEARRTARRPALPIQNAPPSSPSRYPCPPTTLATPSSGPRDRRRPCPPRRSRPSPSRARRREWSPNRPQATPRPHRESCRRGHTGARASRGRWAPCSGRGRPGRRATIRRSASRGRWPRRTAATVSPSSRLTPSTSMTRAPDECRRRIAGLTAVHPQHPHQSRRIRFGMPSRAA